MLTDRSSASTSLPQRFLRLLIGAILFSSGTLPAWAETVSQPVSLTPKIPVPQTIDCELLIVGGGLAGTAAAYESLLAGRTVCMTEITDWVGGQISSQGTSALDERATQRQRLWFPRGYQEFRQRIEAYYGKLNPGGCWVSVACFLPKDGAKILAEMLESAADQGHGTLKWFPSTVIKHLEKNSSGQQIVGAIAIQHHPAPGTPPLNTEPLSQTIGDSYRPENSDRFTKTILHFVPPPNSQERPAPAAWYVVDATETGEVIALADVPYQVGIDPRSYLEPSSGSATADPYCTQGYTYTFAMEATETPQPQVKPSFYDRYTPYYSYEKDILASFPLVFTYRSIWRNPDQPVTRSKVGNIGFIDPKPGDISMQNWTWGNDYRPGTSKDNLILTRSQLLQSGQLSPGGWMGGLRTESLRKAEENAFGYYYWLVAGTTDSRLGAGVKLPYPNHRLLTGLDSPMGTVHGLSKYPYMREVRRLIGRPSPGYPQGFMVQETDISRKDYSQDYYQKTLPAETYRSLGVALSGLDAIPRIQNSPTPASIRSRTRSRIYPDAVGISHYNIDFHPCMTLSPPEAPGNTERQGVRQAESITYPAQIPLRAMIPQQIDNLLVAGKSMAASHTAAAAYRVHGFEWSAGAAAAITIDFALRQAILPYQLVDQLPRPEPQLEALQQRLIQNGNPIAFPGTSIFNLNWEDWK